MARKDSNNGGLAPGPGFAQSAGRPNPAVEIAAGAAFDERGRPKPAVHSMLLKAVEVQRPLVLANLRRLRKRYPNATAFELSQRLERDFLSGVGTGGAAIGATAIIPGVGTVAALSISAAATVVFLEATALYAQSVAELHGVRLQDPEAAQVTVMAIILGDEGMAMLQGLTGHALGNGKTPMQGVGQDRQQEPAADSRQEHHGAHAEEVPAEDGRQGQRLRGGQGPAVWHRRGRWRCGQLHDGPGRRSPRPSAPSARRPW